MEHSVMSRWGSLVDLENKVYNLERKINPSR